ncbi:unnamed protein product, partial [Discosporangium mesarthrocarpum]
MLLVPFSWRFFLRLFTHGKEARAQTMKGGEYAAIDPAIQGSYDFLDVAHMGRTPRGNGGSPQRPPQGIGGRPGTGLSDSAGPNGAREHTTRHLWGRAGQGQGQGRWWERPGGRPGAGTPATKQVISRALGRLGIARATSVRVPHCPHAYGLVLTIAAKATAATGWGVGGVSGVVGGARDWKLVYSGDCRPSSRLVEEGKGAAVLIHEATFDQSKRQV